MTTFHTVLADPPWNERGGGKVKRGADRHYPLLKWPDIVRTMLACPHWPAIADDAHLWVWATANHREDAHRVIDALGFRYVTELVWIKVRAGRLQVGLGQYLRGSHEACLLAVRGSGFAVRTDRRDLSSVVLAERTRHSRKPEQVRELIEARSHGPYLELFARRPVPGWVVWGNEITDGAEGASQQQE